MAVEASRSALLPPSNSRTYDNRPTEKLLPVSGVTSGNVPVLRKRLRDSASFDRVCSVSNVVVPDGYRFGESTFLGEDVTSQISRHQAEVDRLIAQHTEKMRAEIEVMQRQNARRLITAVNQGLTKQLKSKEDEILKIGQVNWSLEEKVQSLIIENQIWKELVQTHEATANALRNQLEQVLSQIQLQQLQQQEQQQLDFANNLSRVLVDDGESCCGSNSDEDQCLQVAENDGNDDGCGRSGGGWRCRKCGREESTVLVLPCRHLCVCTVCVSSVSHCPVCNSAKTAGVVVNMTSF